jgi:hypothetical protein
VKYFNLYSLGGLVALTSLAQSASAVQPPDVVTSDSGGNTAMGTGDLASAVTGSAGLIAVENTASGDSALRPRKSVN